MSKKRLDTTLVELGLVFSRSQAESYIKLGKVSLKDKTVTKAGQLVSFEDSKFLKVNVKEQYVGRAALKLESVAEALNINFKDKVILDVGSSTGGFTEFALKNGAKKVIAVDTGTNQLHPKLRQNPDIELHEKTDIRDFKASEPIDLVLIDVSFISLRQILPSIIKNVPKNAEIVAMVKPQFEAGASDLKHRGVIKNDKMRRQVFKDFEVWAQQYFVLRSKLDSSVSGAKGNQERFYLLQKA
jgi:23S rRNA (cytidine1920-2'-O)/16S rRNA (cytidine1409-2'-O)-methyltransferase